MFVVIVDAQRVKKFGIWESARGYADTMMRRRHDVWILSKDAALRCGFLK